MYASGVVIGFILGFIVFFIQGIKRREENGESFISIIVGSVFGALVAAILSWLSVIIIVLLILSGKAWGISDKNI